MNEVFVSEIYKNYVRIMLSIQGQSREALGLFEEVLIAVLQREFKVLTWGFQKYKKRQMKSCFFKRTKNFKVHHGADFGEVVYRVFCVIFSCNPRSCTHSPYIFARSRPVTYNNLERSRIKNILHKLINMSSK